MKQFILLLFIIFCTETYAQVTIGSNKAPLSGAILDLKQDDNTLAPGSTATKGLGLPRVILTDVRALTIGEGDDKLVIADLDHAWENHTGLLVYNVGDPNVCKNILTSGLYVWAGTEWQALGTGNDLTSGVEVLIDPRDGQEYLTGTFGDEHNIWMLENLRFNPLLNPTVGFDGYIETAANAANDTDKHFYYSIGKTYQPPFDPTDPANNWEAYKENGVFYSWNAVVNDQNTLGLDQGQGQAGESLMNPVQGICPPDWHLPSDREWNELEKEIYQNAYKYSTYTKEEVESWVAWDPAWETTASWRPVLAGHNFTDAQGSAMKYPCPPFGSNNTVTGQSTFTKKGHFNVIMAGRAGNNNTFFYGDNAFFWTSSSKSSGTIYSRMYGKDFPLVSRANPNTLASYSVRCKKNIPGIDIDKEFINVASGYDAHGTSIDELALKITNAYPNKPVTVEIQNHATLGGISFNPALLTSLPAQAEYNYKIQAEPITPMPSVSNPWRSKETNLTFKSVDNQGNETKRVLILNQTNYAFSVMNKFEDFVLPMASLNDESLLVRGNTTWETTVSDDNNILNVISGTGGTVNMTNGSSSSNFTLKLNTAVRKYDTAIITFSDNNVKWAKDIIVTVQTCMGQEDRTNLAAGVEIFTDPRDGEEYFIGKFGDDTWMLENLRFNPTLNVTTGFDNFTESRSSSSIAKHFYYALGTNYQIPFDPTDPANNWEAYEQNGILYNWRAATNDENLPIWAQSPQGQGQTAEGPIPPIQGICPVGWHLPSDREWNELEKQIYENADKYSNYTHTEVSNWPSWDSAWETSTRPPSVPNSHHAEAMKSVCPPLHSTVINRLTNGNSKSPSLGGFNVLLANTSSGSNAYFWTSSSNSTSNSWARSLSSNVNSNVSRFALDYGNLSSVRCKKN